MSGGTQNEVTLAHLGHLGGILGGISGMRYDRWHLTDDI